MIFSPTSVKNLTIQVYIGIKKKRYPGLWQFLDLYRFWQPGPSIKKSFEMLVKYCYKSDMTIENKYDIGHTIGSQGVLYMLCEYKDSRVVYEQWRNNKTESCL